MAIYPNIKIPTLPRMTDYCYAIAELLGFGGDSFLKAFDNNINKTNSEILSDNQTALCFTYLIKKKGFWEGSMGEFHVEMQKTASDKHIDTRSKSWPKSPSKLSQCIKEIRSNLADKGIEFLIVPKCTHGKNKGCCVFTLSKKVVLANDVVSDEAVDVLPNIEFPEHIGYRNTSIENDFEVLCKYIETE